MGVDALARAKAVLKASTSGPETSASASNFTTLTSCSFETHLGDKSTTGRGNFGLVLRAAKLLRDQL